MTFLGTTAKGFQCFPAMTFLEYVCERLMGSRSHSGGEYGDSYWRGPFHGETHPTFHTLPYKPEYPDRWKCFGCDIWGDDFQLLRYFRDLLHDPIATGGYSEHRALLAHWRQEYERTQLNVTGEENPEASPA